VAVVPTPIVSADKLVIKIVLMAEVLRHNPTTLITEP
jgi:hypothetical protein